MESARAEGPYAGIRVLAVTRVVAAPFSTYQLALHGADVITIESADGKGDQARRTGNPRSRRYVQQLMAPHFLSHSANKRSMTLNLASPQGKEVFLKLAGTADVVVENLRTGSMDKLGLGYGDLSRLNSRLIFASLTGFGQTGPKRRDPAIDPIIQAGSGLMAITGTDESGPLKVGAPVIDYFAGMGMAFAIATALYQRQQTGRGQQIDVSLLEAAMVMMSNVVGETLATGVNPPRVGNGSPFGSPTTGSYACKQGFLFISAGQDTQRDRLWQVLQRPDIPADPRFATRQSCMEHLDELRDEIARTLKTKTADEWEQLLEAASLSVMKVRTITEAADHPQIVARGLFHHFDDVQGLGLSARVPKAFYRMSEGPAKITSEPPRLGQHTDEVLRELGYAQADIEALRQAGDI